MTKSGAPAQTRDGRPRHRPGSRAVRGAPRPPTADRGSRPSAARRGGASARAGRNSRRPDPAGTRRDRTPARGPGPSRPRRARRADTGPRLANRPIPGDQVALEVDHLAQVKLAPLDDHPRADQPLPGLEGSRKHGPVSTSSANAETWIRTVVPRRSRAGPTSRRRVAFLLDRARRVHRQDAPDTSRRIWTSVGRSSSMHRGVERNKIGPRRASRIRGATRADKILHRNAVETLLRTRSLSGCLRPERTSRTTVNRLPTGTHWFAKRTSLSYMAEDSSDRGRTGIMVLEVRSAFKAQIRKTGSSRRADGERRGWLPL